MSFENNYTTAEEAVKLITSGDRVFIHSVAAAPGPLINAMTARAPELEDIEIIHLHTEGEAPYVKPEYSDTFRTNALFVGANVRKAVNYGSADYLSIFLSEVPGLFREDILPIDMALVQVSPPDKHGYCSLGVSVDASRAALQSAKKAIALVNPNMPRTHGDGIFHASRFNALVESEEPLHELTIPEPNEIEQEIGENCAELVENGSTLQMGIGAIPNAVLKALNNHRDLGIHTEMFSDGVMELVENGVINGKKKRTHPEKIVAGFVMGSRKLYDFVDDNPMIAMLDIAYVNDTAVIRKNPKVTAINSAIEVDLTGQVCADSIGTYHYSGVGGQMDFIRGASLSEGGKPIIALPSTTAKGESKIVPHLKQGAGVVTTRAHVHYVVTEYGVANLYGKNLRQRAQALIEIAHPDHREALQESVMERFNQPV
ncbi:acetyl-CoA hydrolase/transferase family protein [Fodinibius salsisoli]|uniref:Acetyl-CoA hydrolase/transferase family protein n=1 Tax=Fodinibius salsisoli TaxID=2820877 RepID=A0ABT3PMX0_9BACT|nr:acetyl-CoA hydrolase/transferase C-terminal domain-containing protein [Fodinibius salsisoli]MCW9707299.1 acetyl-CoA hydrolase/transferase family protein [Fodinibius salsisoli]